MIGILLAGIFITKTTSSLTSGSGDAGIAQASLGRSAEAASIPSTGVMSASPETVFAYNEPGSEAGAGVRSARTESPQAGAAQAEDAQAGGAQADRARIENAPVENAQADGSQAEGTQAEGTQTGTQADEAQAGGAQAAGTQAAADQEEPAVREDGQPEAAAAANEAAPAMAGLESAAPKETALPEAASGVPAEETAAEETVKSPLDPSVDPPKDSSVLGEEKEYTLEELKDRLQTVEEQIAAQEEAADSNPASRYMAAEYAWNLWDGELNLIYSHIRSHMSEKEAEDLKREEVAWLKERDLAAEQAYVQNDTPPKQSIQYITISAQKTRERCYELLEQYEDVLER